MKKNLKTKRIYDKYEKSDGERILVDRLWPRGVKKEKARIDVWLKDIAPSDSLRKWFNHDPEKWGDFKLKYFIELDENRDLCRELMDRTKINITLVYAAKDQNYNNALALKEYLEKI